jgi:hypothetical protein
LFRDLVPFIVAKTSTDRPLPMENAGSMKLEYLDPKCLFFILGFVWTYLQWGSFLVRQSIGKMYVVRNKPGLLSNIFFRDLGVISSRYFLWWYQKYQLINKTELYF